MDAHDEPWELDEATVLEAAGFTKQAALAASVSALKGKYRLVSTEALQRHFGRYHFLDVYDGPLSAEDIAAIRVAKPHFAELVLWWDHQKDAASAIVTGVPKGGGDDVHFYVTGWGDIPKKLRALGDSALSWDARGMTDVVDNRASLLEALGFDRLASIEYLAQALPHTPRITNPRVTEKYYSHYIGDLSNYTGSVGSGNAIEVARARQAVEQLRENESSRELRWRSTFTLHSTSDDKSFAVICKVNGIDGTVLHYLVTQWGKERPTLSEMEKRYRAEQKWEHPAPSFAGQLSRSLFGMASVWVFFVLPATIIRHELIKEGHTIGYILFAALYVGGIIAMVKLLPKGRRLHQGLLRQWPIILIVSFICQGAFLLDFLSSK